MHDVQPNAVHVWQFTIDELHNWHVLFTRIIPDGHADTQLLKYIAYYCAHVKHWVDDRQVKQPVEHAAQIWPSTYMPIGQAFKQVLWYRYEPLAQTTQLSALPIHERHEASAQGWHSNRVILILTLVLVLVILTLDINIEVGQLDQQNCW